MMSAALCFYWGLNPNVAASFYSPYQRLKWRLLPRFRRQRMESFLRLMQPQYGAKILDVGGLPSLNGVPGFWHDHTGQFAITLLNLPGAFDHFSKEELSPYCLIEADACKCSDLFEDFDIVFSNAVIEHIGNFRRQKQLADFIRSKGNKFWVQTPSPFFPIEAHCDIPLWWFIPAKHRKAWIARWRRDGQEVLAQQMASTRPIWRGRLRELFPGSTLVTEHFLGLPKSLIAYQKSKL